MALQLVALCKSLSAGLARERFFSSVDALMTLQLAARTNSLCAGIARKRILCEMGAHMHS